MRERGLEARTRTVGVIEARDGRLESYGCCIRVPGEVESGSNGVEVVDLPGGRYAVLTMKKDPEVIGPSIGRFYEEYAPRAELRIDADRPTYEVYLEGTMDYCVPIL